MLVQYKKANLWAIPGAGGLLMIQPGVNAIPDHVWEVMKEADIVKKQLSSGYLVVVQPPQEEKAEDPGMELAGMSAPDAIAVVEKTYVEPVLLKWAEIEKRKGVLKAIENQVEKLEPKVLATREVKVE